MRHFFTTLRFRLILLVFPAVVPVLGVTLYSGPEQRRMAAEEAKQDVMDLVITAAGGGHHREPGPGPGQLEDAGDVKKLGHP